MNDATWNKRIRFAENLVRLKAIEERLNAEIERLQQIIEEDLYSEYSILDFKVDLEMLEGIRDGNK